MEGASEEGQGPHRVVVPLMMMMNLLTSCHWDWSIRMLTSPLQAKDTPACRNHRQSFKEGLEEEGSELNRFKCKHRSYSFSTRILTKLYKLRGFFFSVCDIKRVTGMVVLQKLGKALVHNGDVTMNVCFFKVKKG